MRNDLVDSKSSEEGGEGGASGVEQRVQSLLSLATHREDCGEAGCPLKTKNCVRAGIHTAAYRGPHIEVNRLVLR